MLIMPELTVDRRRWNATVLAHFIQGRCAQLCLKSARAAALAGLDLPVWQSLESGWVPEERETLRLIAAAINVDISQIALLAKIAAANQRPV
jgi:hypothetical protein